MFVVRKPGGNPDRHGKNIISTQTRQLKIHKLKPENLIPNRKTCSRGNVVSNSTLSLNSTPWISLCPSQPEKQQKRELVILPSQRKKDSLLHPTYGESSKFLLDCIVHSRPEHAVRGHCSLWPTRVAQPSTVYVPQHVYFFTVSKKTEWKNKSMNFRSTTWELMLCIT